MKKGVVVISLIVLMFVMPMLLQFALAQEQIPGIPAGLTPEEIEAQIAKAQNATEWQMIGQRFQQALLKNPVIVAIDSFFTKLSIVFIILFGMPYSLSITLLFVMVMWLIVAIDLGNIISSYSTFSGLASYGISFAFAVIFAQLKIFEIIVNFVGTLIFTREAGWARALIILVTLLVLIFIDQISRYLGKYLKKRKEAEEKAETLVSGKEIQATAKGLREGEKLAGKP